jgi:predicted metal-dependent phosphotriesterase family hydrolase
MVNTVLGKINPEDMGYSQPHEHLLLDYYEFYADHNTRLDSIEIAIDEINIFKKAGGCTIVDPTNIGMRRNIRGVREIALATGVNIIAGCGWYIEVSHPGYIREKSVNELADMIIKELTEGIDGTDIRAGIIGEIATESQHYISPAEERVFRAACRAHKQTGAAITTHALFGKVGIAQVELLKDEGIDLSRVIIGHMDTCMDMEYHLKIAESGAYLQYDTCGRWDIYPDEMRVKYLKELVSKGYLERILISCDVFRRSHLHAFRGQGYDYILTHFIPMLKKAGFTDKEIEMITVTNPRRVICGE